MNPAPLMASGREDLRQGLPQAHRAVAGDEFGVAHAAAQQSRGVPDGGRWLGNPIAAWPTAAATAAAVAEPAEAPRRAAAEAEYVKVR
ncbi:hypothetical protein ACFXOD_38450 [Streptomyces sp. NPDC059161]|uniref:hypothetical protein n=1 Tax=Streptomyces sp. NPDC059161 TaxID=3346749 RepID=UPI0036A9B5B3